MKISLFLLNTCKCLVMNGTHIKNKHAIERRWISFSNSWCTWSPGCFLFEHLLRRFLFSRGSEFFSCCTTSRIRKPSKIWISTCQLRLQKLSSKSFSAKSTFNSADRSMFKFHKKYSNLHSKIHCKLPSPTSLPSSPFFAGTEHSFYIRILLAKVKNVNQKMFFVNITLPSVLRSRLADERYDRSQPRLSEWKIFMFLALSASHFAFNRKQISKVRLTRNGKLIWDSTLLSCAASTHSEITFMWQYGLNS